jgi:hypothetical protein
MYNNVSFNINWTHYEVLAKNEFNITDDKFSWDLVDQKISDYMIDPINNTNLRNTVHEFNRLKKNYYNWINILNDNGKYFWDIKLSVIEADKNFQGIWDWKTIKAEAAKETGQTNTSDIYWDIVEEKVLNYIKEKSVLYNNINFTVDLDTETFVNNIITIKGKYRDYQFLMHNNFYFEDISKDKDFQLTINWTKVENRIEVLLNVTNELDINMTLVDVKIKEYEFNSKTFSKKETLIIKELIRVERQYNEYRSQFSHSAVNKNSTSGGLMSDIGNNIHQGTGMSMLLSM